MPINSEALKNMSELHANSIEGVSLAKSMISIPKNVQINAIESVDSSQEDAQELEKTRQKIAAMSGVDVDTDVIEKNTEQSEEVSALKNQLKNILGIGSPEAPLVSAEIMKQKIEEEQNVSAVLPDVEVETPVKIEDTEIVSVVDNRQDELNESAEKSSRTDERNTIIPVPLKSEDFFEEKINIPAEIAEVKTISFEEEALPLPTLPDLPEVFEMPIIETQENTKVNVFPENNNETMINEPADILEDEIVNEEIALDILNNSPKAETPIIEEITEIQTEAKGKLFNAENSRKTLHLLDSLQRIDIDLEKAMRKQVA